MLINRSVSLQQLSSSAPWDCIIIGGGATGLGIAVDAASRGLRTLLLEQCDFAKGTSSRSTKLVHGGVRYLQQGNIRLVMEALQERGLLIQNAPHLVHHQAFIVPNYQWWEKPFYGIGLKIYDRMAGKLGLGPSVMLSAEETRKRLPNLDPADLRGGVLYYDGQFDDARLAISLMQTAAEQGATLLNYVSVKGLLKKQDRVCGVWSIDKLTGEEYETEGRVVINATGVFADRVMRLDDPRHETLLRPSQGIHVVVDRDFLPGDTAIMIPRTDDGRVLFAVPWHDKVVLGTTDTPVTEIREEPLPFPEEIDFVLGHVSRYLARDPERKDLRSVFAGLRPLVKGKSRKTAALARDHYLHIAPSGLITITGGKWTTYRKMAEDTVNLAVSRFALNAAPCRTRTLALYGQDRPLFPASLDSLTETELAQWVRIAVREEACETVEDFLARRSRQLLLDARKALELAPRVARLMAAEGGRNEEWIQHQITNFNEMAAAYLP